LEENGSKLKKKEKMKERGELERTRKRNKIIIIIIIILLFILTAYEFLPGGNGTTIRGSGEKKNEQKQKTIRMK
jgi:flagellar basal body-associated protein FliL